MAITEGMTREQRFYYLSFHGPIVQDAREEFIAACQKYAGVIKTCEAYERVGFTAERFTDQLLDRADPFLCEEIKEWLAV